MEQDSVTLAVIVTGVLGIAAQWLAWRFHVPAILLLTLTGLVIGPGLGWLQPTHVFGPTMEPLISVFVAIVLFEGGMSLHLYEFKQAGRGAYRLFTVGVLLSWMLSSAAAYAIGQLSWPVAVLLGAISVVTGPTVIMPLLRQAHLKRRPASYLKWEGIVNDPLGALLAVLVYEYMVYSSGGAAFNQTLMSIGKALAAAIFLGGGAGYLMGVAYRRGQVPEFLKAPALFAAVLGVYGIANLGQREAGLLTVTLMGLVIGNMRLPSMGEIRRFKEYVTILIVSGIFVLIAADLEPATLSKLNWRSVILLAVLVFVVRPVAVWLSTIRAGMDWRERVLVGWIAPRGIVAAAMAGLFGPRLAQAGYGDAALLLPLIFALILVTVTLHGLTIGRLARRLDLAVARQNGVLIVGASAWAVGLAEALRSAEVDVMIADSSWSRLRPARLAGIPVHFGEILSEESERSMEFNEMGYLLAATSNDAYNALVCTHFAHDHGYDKVFQLPLHSSEEDDTRSLRPELRGSMAFAGDEVFGELERRFYVGWQFQRTRITEEYSYEQHQKDRPDDAMEVLLVKAAGDVVFKTDSQPLVPEPGDTLVTFSRAAGMAAVAGKTARQVADAAGATP